MCVQSSCFRSESWGCLSGQPYKKYQMVKEAGNETKMKKQKMLVHVLECVCIFKGKWMLL